MARNNVFGFYSNTNYTNILSSIVTTLENIDPPRQNAKGACMNCGKAMKWNADSLFDGEVCSRECWDERQLKRAHSVLRKEYIPRYESKKENTQMSHS